MVFLAFMFAFAAGAILPFSPIAVVVAAALLVALVKRRFAVGIAVAIGLTIGAVRAHAAVAAAHDIRVSADQALPRIARCAGEATVATSPVRRGGSLQWTGWAENVDCGNGETARIRVSLFGGEDLARGDRVSFIADLAPPERFADAELGDADVRSAQRPIVRSGGTQSVEVLSRGHSPFAWIDRARSHVRARIDATYTPAVAPMARALVLGESDLDGADDEAFRASGLSHLLAVSGMHLVLVVAGAVKLFRALLVRTALARRWDVGRFAALLGLPLTWIYADFSGGSGSAVRAAWMITAHLGLRALGRRNDAWRALAISVGAFALVDPLAAFDVSFVLSAAATFGMLAFAERFDAALASRLRFVPRAIVKSLATTAAATVACAPIIARMSGSVALVGLVANVVAVPVGEAAALPVCLAHTLLAPLPSAEAGAAAVASGALVVTRWIARTAALAPPIRVPPPTDAQLAIMAVTLGALAMRRIRVPGALAAGAVILLLELRARAIAKPTGQLRATFFDVGQGDSALVDLPDGTAILVDGGGIVGSPVDVGQRVVAPMLRTRRRGELRAVVLSHPHPDHYGGLPAALRDVKVGALWDTGQGEREGTGGAYAVLLSQVGTRGWAKESPESLCGSHVLGGAIVEVLAPCPSADVGRGPNDNSFVIRFRFGARAFLFVGDAEHEEEAELVRNHGDALHADVLKVGHHGSRTSTTAPFLDAVNPSIAIVSTGIRNRFGHPHVSTIERLEARRIRTFRTDRDGAVVVATDGETLTVCPGLL
ncbi:DNA internalization-related competence protein ComEC/Rec2 [soil metagenome]